jgi:hypothetical protein
VIALCPIPAAPFERARLNVRIRTVKKTPTNLEEFGSEFLLRSVALGLDEGQREH